MLPGQPCRTRKQMSQSESHKLENKQKGSSKKTLPAWVYLWHGKERSPAHRVTSVNMHCFLMVFKWVRTLSGCEGLWNNEMFMEPVLVRDFRFSWTVTDMAALLGTYSTLSYTAIKTGGDKGKYCHTVDTAGISSVDACMQVVTVLCTIHKN